MPESDKLIQNIFLKLHNEVFLKMNEQYINVFLCGGASSTKQKSLRDIVKADLSKKKNIRILYPEDLFIEMLNKDKNSNLLTLEEFLASNSDVICIICESPGSLVELGAFTNNAKTFPKVVAVINEKYKKQQSFIMLGPIKLIQNNNKENVIFYKEGSFVNLINQLNKHFSINRMKKIKSLRGKNQYLISSFIGLYHFIPLVLYFFNSYDVTELEMLIKNLITTLGYDDNEYEKSYKSALRLLYKDKLIRKKTDSGKLSYSLTPKGYDSTTNQLDNIKVLDKNRLYNGIRLTIMNMKYY